VLAAAATLAAWVPPIVFGLRWPDYRASRDFISELGAVGAPDAGTVNVSFPRRWSAAGGRLPGDGAPHSRRTPRRGPRAALVRGLVVCDGGVRALRCRLPG
jgi:hypothetical protein